MRGFRYDGIPQPHQPAKRAAGAARGHPGVALRGKGHGDGGKAKGAREELIACSRTQLDPRIVDILLEIVSGDIRIAPPNPSAAAA